MPQPFESSSPLSGEVDTVSVIQMSYNVNLTNNGNITIIGRNGKFHDTEGTTNVSGLYYGVSDPQSVTIGLEYPPVFGSTTVYQNDTQWRETHGTPQQYEYMVNYAHARLELPAGSPADIPFSVVYLPKYVYPDPLNNRNVVIHNNQVFGDYTGPIQIDYDAQAFIEIRVQQTIGGEYVENFPVVMQNPQLAIKERNPLSLEY